MFCNDISFFFFHLYNITLIRHVVLFTVLQYLSKCSKCLTHPHILCLYCAKFCQTIRNVYVYYIHVCAVCMYVFACVRVCVCIYICVFMCVGACVFMFACVCVFVYLCVRIFVCVRARACVCKAIANGPIGKVLAGALFLLFLKVKTKFRFTKSK